MSAGAPRGRASSPSALKHAGSPSRGLSTTFANANGGPLFTTHTYEEGPGEKSVDPLEKLKQTLNEMNTAPNPLSKEEKVREILAVVKGKTTLTNSDGKWTAEFCSEAGQCIAVALTVAAAILLIRWTSASSMGGGRRSRSRKNQKNRKTRRHR